MKRKTVISKNQDFDDALEKMETFFHNPQERMALKPVSISTTAMNSIPASNSGGLYIDAGKGGFTVDAGKTWYTPTEFVLQQEYERRRDIFEKIREKDIIDIGINANVACITFDDYSILEISTKFDWMTLHEYTDLISLNGGKLRDIVMHLHHSQMTNVFAHIQIMSTWGNSVVIEISSHKVAVPPNHFLDFNYIEQPNNAVRKQTPTI